MPAIRSRIIESLVEGRLRTHGGVLVTGPKAAGKTTTARQFAASEVRLDRDQAALTSAQTDPSLILAGDHPRLIDEYQLAEGVWNAVRGWIDDRGEKGLYLLTGSASPDHDQASHTGARRIAPLHMRTMSFAERGLSGGETSVGALLNGRKPDPASPGIGVTGTVEALAVGGWPDNLALDTEDALEANRDHLALIADTDISRVDATKRNPDWVRKLLASYARNVATDASLRTIGKFAPDPPSEKTLHDYVNALKRLYLIEDQDSWKPGLRSKIRLAATPKRHLADPSLAVAALNATPDRLLGPEIELTGFLFESQVVHDLRAYAQPHRAEVRFYRDNKGLEVDAIVEATDGRWIGLEVKLGHSRVDEGAANLLALRAKLTDETNELCGALVVVVADSPTYTRPDGVTVTSLAALGP